MPGGSGGLAPDLTEAKATGTDAAAIRWADFRLRVTSAAILGPLALLCLWFGGTAFVLLVGIGAVGIVLEWVRMCGDRPGEPAALAVAAGVIAGMAAAVDAHPLAGLTVLAAATALSYWLARAGGRSGIIAAGVPYIGVAAVALLWLRADATAGRADLLFLVLTVWASDIGAYLVGRWIGGPRLAPRISPGKTWSGAAGGLTGGCLCGLVVAHLFGGGSASWHVIAVAAVIGVVAQAGDLLESLIKRRFGVKDSGRTIPGHGGLLDRLDGLLTAGPVAALLALAAGRGLLLWQ
jgi:phosphatidate cytidylyltransferase